ncbi:MAG: phosphate signaling complex protein PhoU [Candidatus Hydrogenedentota bacterium]
MSVHLERAIKKLKKHLLVLGGRVEENVRMAVQSVIARDGELAKQAIANDDEIDQLEVDIEEEALKILALYQPVAIDLRFIAAALKMNNDLERIGDVAVNIGERGLYLSEQTPVTLQLDFATMAEKTQQMLKCSLDSLVNVSAGLAREVCASDDEVDAMNREMYELVKESMHNHADEIDSLIHLLSVSRHLERIADLATNIAEDVIYLVEGEIVRHRTEDYRKTAATYTQKDKAGQGE